MKAEASSSSQTTQIADYARRRLSELLVIEGANAPGTRPWFVLGRRDEIETILATALADNGEAAARARVIEAEESGSERSSMS
jgi:hypothetical protein